MAHTTYATRRALLKHSCGSPHYTLSPYIYQTYTQHGQSKKRPQNAFRELHAAIDDFISRQGNKTFNYKQVAHALGIDTKPQQKAVAMRLAELEFDGILVEVAPGKYQAPSRGTEAIGTFSRRSNGKNGVILDGEEDNLIFVAERNSMHAQRRPRKGACRSPPQRPGTRNARCLKLSSRMTSSLSELSLSNDT